MERTPLDLGTHNEFPLIQIDQSQCFAESGQKGNVDLAVEIKQNVYSQVMSGIAEKAMEGDRLASIDNGGNPLADIAFQKGLDEEHYFNVVSMPRSRPRIDFKEGKVSYNVTGGGVKINYVPQKPIVDVTLGDVEVGYSQKPYLDIEYIGNKLNQQI